MTMNEYFDEFICWKAEILGISRDDGVLVAEYVRIQIVTTTVKIPKRNPRLPEPLFVHLEAEEEFPSEMIQVIEGILADSLFELWLQERTGKGLEHTKESGSVPA